jgi:Fe-S cluster assembly protein SufD
VTQPYLADFETFSSNGGGGGPAWLPPVRRAAIARFAALGFPTQRNEDWHFTSVAPIAESEFHPLSASSGDVQAADLEPYLFGRRDWPRFVFVNGRYAPELSSADGAPIGVRVMNLGRAWHEAPDVLQRHLSKIATFDEQSFTALNTAFMSDGALVHVAKDVQADAPIHLLHVVDPIAARVVMHPRHLLVVDRQASARIIESYVSLGDARYFTNAVTEIALSEGSILDHYKLERESGQAYHVHALEVRQERSTQLTQHNLALGGQLARTDVNVLLDGPGADCVLNGLFVGRSAQHLDNHTVIDHAKPHGTSRELYKGILDGKARGVFHGKIIVRPDAQKTDAMQTNKNLLLSPEALVNSTPALEIFADDVKCKHGSTIGQLDPTALFYLRSRGIGEEQARDLLTYAFAADVAGRIRIPAIRAEVEQFLGTALRRGTETA